MGFSQYEKVNIVELNLEENEGKLAVSLPGSALKDEYRLSSEFYKNIESGNLEVVGDELGYILFDRERGAILKEKLKEIKDGKRAGVSLDSCVELTHLISPLLDVTPPVSGDYRLEVGTAGIERKLMNINHFKKSIGEKVSLLHSGKEKTRGILTKLEGSKVFVQTEDEETSVEFNDIIKAKTYFEW